MTEEWPNEAYERIIRDVKEIKLLCPDERLRAVLTNEICDDIIDLASICLRYKKYNVTTSILGAASGNVLFEQGNNDITASEWIEWVYKNGGIKAVKGFMIEKGYTIVISYDFDKEWYCRFDKRGSVISGHGWNTTEDGAVLQAAQIVLMKNE